MKPARHESNGFTLIELSIVLVIIGLIVGGVLVGQDLVKAAEIRAQVSQIDKIRVAVNTFLGKYEALPGDMNSATARRFGFAARGAYAGEGDGNQIIEGVYSDAANQNSGVMQSGEILMFWSDLTYANGMNLNLIEGSFNSVTPTDFPAQPAESAIPKYFPVAKLGAANYLYMASTNSTDFAAPTSLPRGRNMIGLGGIGLLQFPYLCINPVLRSSQAYMVDKKMDDGLPESGTVTATLLSVCQNGYMPAPCTDTSFTPSRYALDSSSYGMLCALSFITQ